MGHGSRFVFKHGIHSYAALCDAFDRSISVDSASKMAGNSTLNEHAQIWKRIRPTHAELTKMRWAIPNLKKHCTFSVVLPRQDNDAASSVNKQIYDKVELIYAAPNEAVQKATGEYILFLQPGDFLHPNALFEITYELNRIGKMPSVLYFDHDYFVGDAVAKPYYKPGWSPDLLLVNNYINRACAFRRDVLVNIEILDMPFYAVIYDALLKMAELGDFHHKPGILLTMPDSDDERAYDPQENIIRANAIKRRGVDGEIEGNEYGVASLKRKVRSNPVISIIIPTCFTGSYIEDCITSIEHVSTYKNYEIIVIDNSRKAPSFGESRLIGYNCKILYIHEPFNWSRLNNHGLKAATGDIIVFLNDDTEIITPDWLERLAAEAQRPEIGMVGPMVLYPNGTIYSSGMYIRNQRDISVSFWYVDEQSKTYHNLLHYTRPSLITHGVCFAIEKEKIVRAGGFDERFPVLCNEIVLSLNMKNIGVYNLVQSEVKIVHHVSASRKDTYDESEDRKRFFDLFGHVLQDGDPYFNPYLNSSNINDYTEDPSPTICRHIGSPTISAAGLNKILIIKLDHIGDVVLAMPSIRKTRKLFPRAKIDVLCGPWVAEMLEQQPEINKVHTFDYFADWSDEEKKQHMLSSMKTEKYDLAINLRKYPDTLYMAPMLADYSLILSQYAQTDDVYYSVPAISRNPGSMVSWHFKDQLLSLVSSLEYDETLDREVSVPSEICDRVNKGISRLPLFESDMIIGMHVASRDSHKKYPEKNFSILCDLIHEKTNASIVLFGSKEDEATNAKVISMVRQKDRIMSVAGMFTLTEFFCLVKKVDYFIGNDSGPAHIAGIQGIATLVVFGNRHPSFEWMPIGNSILVGRFPACAPCYDLETCVHNDCLLKIQPGDIFSGLERLMVLYPTHRKN